MYSYNFMEWLLFFYIYCFFGWIWESLYVSVCKAQWTNRGFMHGPALPIYGTGATIMLFLTIPFKSSVLLTFLVGMIGATTLEFVTGASMQKIFGVRYWDYSKCFLNVKGHICLKASVLWGVFSVLLINYIHAPVNRVVTAIPFGLLQVIVIFLTAIFSSDFSASVREALDLKELLINLTESNEELSRIEKRIEAITSVVGTEIKEKSTEKLVLLNETIEEKKQKIEEYKAAVREKRKSAVFITKNIMLNNLSVKDKLKTEYVNAMSEKINLYLEKVKSQESGENADKDATMELAEYQNAFEKHKHKMQSRNVRSYMNMLRLLRRNPDAVSEEYQEALSELAGLDDKGKKESQES